MSFFCNFNSEKCPGQIKGNPINGLCEKTCIQVKKVFDACIQQSQINGIVLTLDNFSTTPTYPLTFISAKNTVSTGTISNLSVEPIQGERPNSSRVKGDVIIDDYFSNLKGDIPKKFLFDSYHNKEKTEEELKERGVQRVKDWQEVCDILLNE